MTHFLLIGQYYNNISSHTAFHGVVGPPVSCRTAIVLHLHLQLLSNSFAKHLGLPFKILRFYYQSLVAILVLFCCGAWEQAIVALSSVGLSSVGTERRWFENKLVETTSWLLCPQGLTIGRSFCTSTLGRSWWIYSTPKFPMPTEGEE